MEQHTNQAKQHKTLPIWLYCVIYGGVVAACIALDQLTKHFIEGAVQRNHGRIRILGDWLTLVWTTNSGATGGLFAGLSWSNWLFFIMTLIGLPVFGWLWWRSRTRSVWGQIAFSFVIGGTVGNAIDRIRFAEDGFFSGSVRDFIQVEGFFGIFNIADSFLVVGVIMALLAIAFFDPDSLLHSVMQERSARLAAQSGSDADTDPTSDPTPPIPTAPVDVSQQDVSAANDAAPSRPESQPIPTQQASEPSIKPTQQASEPAHPDEKD